MWMLFWWSTLQMNCITHFRNIWINFKITWVFLVQHTNLRFHPVSQASAPCVAVLPLWQLMFCLTAREAKGARDTFPIADFQGDWTGGQASLIETCIYGRKSNRRKRRAIRHKLPSVVFTSVNELEVTFSDFITFGLFFFFLPPFSSTLPSFPEQVSN